MFPNTFEAYLATYKLNKLSFSAEHIRSWQGFSAGLDDDWVDTGAKGTSFSKNNFDFLYAYAQFKGSANRQDIKKFITEHNVAVTYTYNKNLTLSMIYANLHNKKNTLTNDGTWDDFRVLLSYGF